MPTKVYYNNIEIPDAPFVSRSKTPMDYGGRWGMVENITLNGTSDDFTGGFYDTNTGTCSIPEHDNNQSACIAAAGSWTPNPNLNKYFWQHITEDIFRVNFKEFKVVEDGVEYMKYPSVMIDSIDFPQDKYGEGAPIKYVVKLKAYDVFSNDNIIEPSDSYSFTENEDGTVDVSHKVSAKGVKSVSASAFDNAVTFVNKFVGVDHFGVCNPYFINNSTPILINKAETSDRLAGTYQITESYKYQNEVGIDATTPVGYVVTSKINLNESSKSETNPIKFDASYTANETYGMANLRTAVQSDNVQTQLKAVLGVNTSEIYRTSYSINEDPDAYKIDYQATFVTGMSNIDRAKGFFDPKITMTTDAITDITVWTIDGQYVTYGSVPEKNTAITNFRDNTLFDYDAGTADDSHDFVPFLIQTLKNSEVYKVYGNQFGFVDGECTNDLTKSNPTDCAAAGHGWVDYNHPDATITNHDSLWLTSSRVTHNQHKGTLTFNATFTDEDRVPFRLVELNPLNPHLEKGNASPHLSAPVTLDAETNEYFGIPVKYNVSVTESINKYELIPSANVEGIFALQNLNCKTKAKIKMTYTTQNKNQSMVTWGNYTVDEQEHAATNEVNRALERKIFNYNNKTWRTADSRDRTIGRTSTRNKEYTYDPGDNIYKNWQGEVYNRVAVAFVDHRLDFTRRPGLKFGF